MSDEFEALVGEGEAAPTAGWDFSWFEGRATEARPPWGYQRLLAERLRAGNRVLDLQTGGGEVLSGALRMADARPRRVAATESWAPNVPLARAALSPWSGQVSECADDEIPFQDQEFDLVAARHPVVTPWPEAARVLVPGGTFLSQQIGPGTVRELTEALVGPFEISRSRSPERAVRDAENAGLRVVRLESASLPMAFDDIGAVIAFCRKVVWTVPDFSVAAYRPALRAVHERILAGGPLRATSERFLIECHRPV